MCEMIRYVTSTLNKAQGRRLPGHGDWEGRRGEVVGGGLAEVRGQAVPDGCTPHSWDTPGLAWRCVRMRRVFLPRSAQRALLSARTIPEDEIVHGKTCHSCYIQTAL